MRQLCKGNVAVVKGAILAGCRSLLRLSHHSGQRDCRIRGALHSRRSAALSPGGERSRRHQHGLRRSCGWARVMTASSGPGLSLMQEGMSYLAGAELPCVIVDVVRGGPGLGNIAPEQSDYFAMVKGGGHGNYRNIVLAPASVQEMADLTILAFELADKYRNPAVVMADGFIGQMMEPLDLEYREIIDSAEVVGR